MYKVSVFIKHKKIFILLMFVVITLILSIMIMNNGSSIKWTKYKTLESRASIVLQVKSRPELLESYSVLELGNPTGAKLQLVAEPADSNLFWGEENKESDVSYNIQKGVAIRSYYDSVEQKIKEESLPNDKSKDIYIENQSLIAQYKGTKTFNVTSLKNYKIIIKNISGKKVKIDAWIYYK